MNKIFLVLLIILGFVIFSKFLGVGSMYFTGSSGIDSVGIVETSPFVYTLTFYPTVTKSHSAHCGDSFSINTPEVGKPRPVTISNTDLAGYPSFLNGKSFVTKDISFSGLQAKDGDYKIVSKSAVCDFREPQDLGWSRTQGGLVCRVDVEFEDSVCVYGLSEVKIVVDTEVRAGSEVETSFFDELWQKIKIFFGRFF